MVFNDIDIVLFFYCLLLLILGLIVFFVNYIYVKIFKVLKMFIYCFLIYIKVYVKNNYVFLSKLFRIYLFL